MCKFILIALCLLAHSAWAQESSVRALAPTLWVKGYHGVVITTTTRAISTVKDLSGAGRNFTQATGSLQAVNQTSGDGIWCLPTITLDGVDDKFTSAATLADVIDPDGYTIFAVFRPTSVADGVRKIFSDSLGKLSLHMNGANLSFTAGGVTVTRPTVIAVNTPHIAKASYDGTKLYVSADNGSPDSETASAISDLLGTLLLGDGWTGDLSELVVFDKYLTAEESNTVYAYLDWTLSDPHLRVEILP